MVVILEATAGPIAGRKIEIRSGSILRLGRTAKSDYAIGEDSYLSGQHFAVEYDGSQCRVRDLGSSNGTFVNGDRISERVMREGDCLVAGGSTFTIHMDAAGILQADPADRTNTSPTVTYAGVRTTIARSLHAPSAEGGEWPGFSRQQSLLLTALYRPGEKVYAVLDASRDSRIPAFVDASGEPYTALDTAGRVPAYVVAVPPKARLLDVLIKDGWSRGWGFYCMTHSTLEELSAHWNRYVFLYTQDAKAVTFRFWDPRVLRVLTPMMGAQEAEDFFGPANRMIVESDKAEIAIELTRSPRGGRQNTLMLI